MITKRIAHQTSGEAKPVIPVHDHFPARFAVSDAPRFSNNSETTTHATLNASCIQGFAKPEGRPCIDLFVMSSGDACRAVVERRWETSLTVREQREKK